MYRLGTLTAVLLLLLLPGYPCEEMKVDLAQCEAACGMGIYYEGCKCFRQLFRWGKRSSPTHRAYPASEDDAFYPRRYEDDKMSRAQLKKILYKLLTHLR